jgi:hypothetical protein
MASMKWKKVNVVVDSSALVSAGFTVEDWAIFYGALFPAMDDGSIGLAISIDGGTTYNPVIDPADGADAILVASGADPGWVDFSDWIRFLGANDAYLVRFTCVSQTSGAVTITVLMRG